MIEWNTLKYIDCLDPKEGLPSLPDKSVDIGYTDYPWGVKMHKNKTRKFQGRTLKWDENKEYYDDNFKPEWNLQWFNELKRICNGIVILIPEKKEIKKWWWSNTNPRGDLIIHWKNGFSAVSIARHSQKSTYLFYGKFKHRLHKDVLGPITMTWGFLKKHKWVHPSPKGWEIAHNILGQIKPESLIDPFAGSGSFLKAADLLGIKWLGYELNETYKPDFDYLFNECIGLEEWLK